MFGRKKDPSQEVMRRLRESMSAREYAAAVMGGAGGDPAPGSRRAREIEGALRAARSEHEAALRIADEHRAELDPGVLELVDSYRYNPPPFVMHPAKPYRATVVGPLTRMWPNLDDEQRSRTHRERHVDAASPFYRGGREPDDCPLCADASRATSDAGGGDALAGLSVDQRRAVLQATAPDVLEEMRSAGIVSDRDFCLLLSISTGTDADADIDLDAYRALLVRKLASYTTMGPSALIEDVESGGLQSTLEDANVLRLMPQAALGSIAEGLVAQYRRAKAMPADARALADRMQPPVG